MRAYELTVSYWDQVFEKVRPYNPLDPLPQPELEAALGWLANDSARVLDFGCGTGRYLLRLLAKGVDRGIGIDLSPEAICRANELARQYGMMDRAFFLNGSLRCLHELAPESYDGALLFNIVDNMLPDDAMDLIKQLHRLLAYRGRVLLKLNACEDPAVLDVDPAYEKVASNLYMESSGLYFWNLSDDAVEELLTPYFFIESVERVSFPNYGADNRLFYLRVM